MNVSAWSIRNPIPSLMIFVLLTVAGILSWQSMKVQNFPDLDLPTVTVTATPTPASTYTTFGPRRRPGANGGSRQGGGHLPRAEERLGPA